MFLLYILFLYNKNADFQIPAFLQATEPAQATVQLAVIVRIASEHGMR